MTQWSQWIQWATDSGLKELGPWIAAGLRILAIVLLAWLLWRFLNTSIQSIGQRLSKGADSAGEGRRFDTLTRVMAYIASIVVSIVAALVVLSEIGVSVAPILGAAGVAGIAIGFGAQSLVKDFFTGFFLLLEDQIRTGDVVKLADHSGVVEKFNLRSVQLRDYEGNVHYIPNSNITSVTNMSRGFAFAVMDISVGYAEDTDAVFEVLNAVAREMQADPSLAPSIRDDLEIAGVNQLADSAVIIRCRIRVEALDQWRVRREFLSRTKKAFDKAGIKIPYPHRQIINTNA